MKLSQSERISAAVGGRGCESAAKCGSFVGFHAEVRNDPAGYRINHAPRWFSAVSTAGDLPHQPPLAVLFSKGTHENIGR
jgi:hypothetical protein